LAFWSWNKLSPKARCQGMPASYLCKLGSFSLQVGDRKLPSLATQKARALLAYLVLHRGSDVGRERARERAESIADVTRHASSKFNLYEPFTAGIANALSMGSAALFERLEDGGNVRASAQGWPPGTTWHILPNDQLAVLVDKSRRAVNLDSLGWRKRNHSSGAARPTVMFPIGTGRTVAMLLCGAHEMARASTPTRYGSSVDCVPMRPLLIANPQSQKRQALCFATSRFSR
jgi:hypothetical protein